MEFRNEIKDNPSIVLNEKELRAVSNKTSKEECEKLKIWDKLKTTLKKTDNGVGLAAIQIGYPICAALAILVDEKGREYQHCLLNPEIIEKSSSLVRFKKEGCLSFPGKYVNTIRHQWVTIKDELNGEITYKGFEAIVVQHEIDHMNGILMFDHEAPGTFVRDKAKIGRNEPCPCKSGKKYKKCCGKQ